MTGSGLGFREKLERAWKQSNSLLCVGLDPEWARLPFSVRETDSPYFEFCRRIVDATAAHVCAFKPQFAHFAALGKEDELARLCAYVKVHHPDVVLILDAKRGDVGSTAKFYAQEAYCRYEADAVTVSPYLGKDSVSPYLEYQGRGVVVLCRTSNPASDWLQANAEDSEPIYHRVARTVAEWNAAGQFMLVAGATYPEELGEIRALVGSMPLLVPGVGAQGGDLEAVLAHGLSDGVGLVISSSRGVIYAGEQAEHAEQTAVAPEPEAFFAAAGRAAADLQDAINSIRDRLTKSK